MSGEKDKENPAPQTPDYYECPRHEVAELVSGKAVRILDVGCGAGVLGEFLKKRQVAEVWGVECCADAAKRAAGRIDRILNGSIEENLQRLPDEYFDTIICADVLENLVDPWNVLSELKKKLVPGGELVASIPNVRHWSVIWGLLEGHWQYCDAGLLDRTHLRFFTKRTVMQLFDDVGLELVMLQGMQLNADCRPAPQLIALMLSIGMDVSTLEEDSQHYQYLCKAVSRCVIPQSNKSINVKSTANSNENFRKAAISVIEEAERLALRGEHEKGGRLILTRGLRIAPDWPEPYMRLARLMLKAGCIPEALAVVQQVPDGADSLQLLELETAIYLAAGDESELAKKLEELSGLNPDSAAALYTKGIMAYRAGVSNQAEDYFGRAMHADPSMADPCAGLGLIKWTSGDKRAAADLILRAVMLDPCDRRIIGLAMDVGRTLRVWDQLISLLQNGNRLYPDSRATADALLEALCSAGRGQEGLRLALGMLGRFGVDDQLLDLAVSLHTDYGAPDHSAAPLISLTMIVRNEEGSLARCLASALPVVDELIVVDTGSDDRTVALAEIFGARVLHYTWNDDYAVARNAALEAAHGAWILSLDADEALAEQDYPLIREAVSRGTSVAWQVTTRNYTEQSGTEGWEPNDGSYPQEQTADGWYPSRKVRLFPRQATIRFRGTVHEMVEPSLRDAGVAIMPAPFIVHHYGELDQLAVLERKQRYYRIGKEKLLTDPENTEQLAELAMQAGELGLAQEALELWDQLLKRLPGHPEALFNRSHALITLGRYAEARDDAAQAVSRLADHKESALNLALAELHCGVSEQACSRVARLYASHPAWPPLVALQLACAVVSGNSAIADACRNQLRASNHGVEMYLGELAVTLAKAGQYSISQRITDWISGVNHDN